MTTDRQEGRAAPASHPHHRVRINYVVRASAFGIAFLGIGIHAWERGFGPLVWAALGAQFLVYPHLLFLRARSARDQLRAELDQHLTLDSFLLAAWVPVLQFPLWIAFALVFSTTLNAIVNRGLPGLAWSAAASCLGVLAGIVAFGLRFRPETSTLVTALCFFGSIAYGAGIGYLLYRQARRVAETRESLRQSEERYRIITENAADLIALVDVAGRWVYSSPSHRALLAAYDLEPGQSAFRCIHAEDYQRVQDAFGRAVATATPFKARVRLLASDGYLRFLEMSGQPVADASGAVSAVVLVSRDVTEMRRQLERLEIAGHAFERMAEGIMICRADGRIVSVNRAYSEITGYPAEEVTGQPEKDFRSAMQPPEFYDEVFAEVIRSGKWSGTVWSRRRDGNLYRESRTVTAVRDDSGQITHFVTLFFDTGRPMAAASAASA